MAWEVEADGSGDLILAGEKLVAAGGDAITVIALPESGRAGRSRRRSIPVDAPIERLIVADEKLFAVTLDGQIMAWGDRQTARQCESGQASPSESSFRARDRA